MFCDPCTAGPRQFYPLRNNNMSKFDVYHRDVTGSLNDDKIIQTALEDFKTSIVTNKPILVEIQNHLGGRALAVGIQSLSNYNSFLVITYYDRPKEFVYALNHWEVYELVTKSDLTDNLNHKKQILPWGNYGDGNHSISNFTFGSNLYIAVGTSAKVQKRCSIISPNDSIQIPHPEGFITIVFNDTNHITVSGTTGNYQLREIRASDFLGV